MSWMEELEQMESSEEIKEEQNYDSVEEKSNEESTNIDSLEDLLKQVDANFDSLSVIIELKNLDEDVEEALKIVKDRLNELIKKGDEFGLTDKQKENIIEKYNRMIGPKTNKL